MTQQQTPRVWTLTKAEGAAFVTGPLTESTRVVEAAPVAELLERVEKAISTRTMLHVEVEALLRTLRGSP